MNCLAIAITTDICQMVMKCQAHINLLGGHNNPVTFLVLLPALHRWENPGPERLSTFLKATQIVGNRAGI